MRDRKRYNKQYYKDNCEELKKKARQYYKDNREERLKQKKQYRDNNPKKVKDSVKRSHEKNRDVYRMIAEEKLGRNLREGENVHHIDMVNSHNYPENLHIYENGSNHQKGHASLNQLVYGLLSDNIIGFKNGGYFRV